MRYPMHSNKVVPIENWTVPYNYAQPNPWLNAGVHFAPLREPGSIQYRILEEDQMLKGDDIMNE